MVIRAARRIGVLALQGDFKEHFAPLERTGAEVREVRRPEQLEGLSGLIIPGGESTAIARLMRAVGLERAIAARIADGMAVWGTCAGMILLAKRVDPPLEVAGLELMDVTVARNWYGRQTDSFEADLQVERLGGDAYRAVFIRAPLVTAAGGGVEPLARLDDGNVVAARQGGMLATAFHPELTGDDRFHKLFVEMAAPAATR